LQNPILLAFVRERYPQLLFSEAELRRKEVGMLGTVFRPAWRKPKAILHGCASSSHAMAAIRLILGFV